MSLLIALVVLFCTLPLSAVVLLRNQSVLTEKTFEVCRNLGSNIANLATEELLVDQTYDATNAAIRNLEASSIEGLLDSYVVNLDGRVVSALKGSAQKEAVSGSEKSYLLSLRSLELREESSSVYGKSVFRFVYPIFIVSKNGEQLRVGSAVFVFDRGRIFAPISSLRKSIFIISAVLLTFGLGVGFLAAVYFAKPIQILTEGARTIGGGDLSHRINLKQKDEIGELARSFNQMTEQIQDFTQNLEQKVATRTEELNRALGEVTALKQQQDGDYFLTSLLVDPLKQNRNDMPGVDVNFYINQKKKFQFKKWKSEIGGDICVADSLTIGSSCYSLFVNADAMGKSIQGAGGALVLGALLQAIIVRSKAKKNSSQFPELWLRDTFYDLQSIFVSFNGSMYMSMIIGLVSEDGLLYFINAEHPWPVLFRNGTATFLEKELLLRKLGIPGEEEKLRVRVFQLEKDDTVICGSDGRDDILIRSNDKDIMNEDERLFLKAVEDGNGNVEKIADVVAAAGALTDDLSLLGVRFRGKAANPGQPDGDLVRALEESKKSYAAGEESEAVSQISSILSGAKSFPDLLNWAGRLYFNRGDFDRALECYRDYLTLVPSDDEVLYIVSCAMGFTGKLKEAADNGERLYLRNPEHFLNLVNLAVVYLDLGVLPRARKMILKALEINPDHEQALQVYEKLKRALSGDDPQEKADPDFISRRLAEAMVHYSRKEFTGCLRILTELASVDDENAEILFRTANCLRQMKRLDEAVRYYNRVILLKPEHYRARNNLATIYYMMEKKDAAKGQLEKALEIQQDYRAAKINMRRLKQHAPSLN